MAKSTTKKAGNKGAKTTASSTMPENRVTATEKSSKQYEQMTGSSFDLTNIEALLQKTFAHWKENLDTENIKADTIGDLEKLIKLRLLLISESEQKKSACELIMTNVIAAIKDVIHDPELRIKIFNRLKEIEMEE